MEQQDNAVAEPQAQEVQEQVEETQPETTNEENEVNEADVTPEPLESEAQTQEPVEETEEEEEPDYFNPQAYQTPQQPTAQVDINQFVDSEGRIDMVGYNQAIQAQMQQTVQAAVQTATQYTSALSQYEKDWQKAEQAFPQLAGKDGKELKEMVQAIHERSATNPNGKYLSPLKAAQKFFQVTSQAKAEGMKTAQETRTVQAAATLASPNPPAQATETQSASKLKETMRRAPTAAQRKQAANQIIANMVNKGLL